MNNQPWYLLPAPHQDIVLSSRIRLARNLNNFPFQRCMTDDQRIQVVNTIKQALSQFKVDDQPLSFLQMDQLNTLARYALVESYAVSREFIQTPQHRVLGMSSTGHISLMINEEDHLRIQILQNGLDLTKAYQLADQLDDWLDQKLHYAFDESLGFLTSCPTNLGTGLRASVMLHLPALEQSGLIGQLTSTINKLGFTIRGTYGESSTVIGSMYQISNQITLGITETDAISNLENIVFQVIESEKHARESLIKSPTQLEDTIFRSYGLLCYARLLSSQEFVEHISNLRLGISLKLLDQISIPTINQLMMLTGTATLCEQQGQQLSPAERDAHRAKLVRKLLVSTPTNSTPEPSS